MKPFYSQETDKPVLKDAATVILTRDNGVEPFEIFLMRRHRQSAFMGGAFVFPGGSLDEADRDPALSARLSGLTPEQAVLRLNEPDLDPAMALGLYFAAVRETFEEAGALLARRADGRELDLTDPAVNERFQNCRLALNEQKMSLKELAEQENLVFALDLLTPYSHWITPEIESRRFDTRFLLARAPAGQAPIHDSIEMTESLWITPAEALEKQTTGEVILMPPTLKTLEELARFSSLQQLFDHALNLKIEAVMPQAFSSGDQRGVLLPHDPDYSIPGLKRPHNPDEPSRVVMIDGRWVTMKVGKR